MTWSDGYFTGLNYTHGYYRELSPGILRLACLGGAIAPPSRERPVYLELGFGQGDSINIHAAATEGQFWGTDFNPAHVVQARSLAEASGADLHLFDDSFGDFAARQDLPDFDIIALHGIWSWISGPNRQVIVDLVRRKLRPGGILYISYNCLPGWAPIVPLRQLLTLYGDYGGGQIAGPLGQIDGAIQLVTELQQVGPAFFRDNPAAAAHLERLSKSARSYVAHEYLNADWHLAHFSDMVRSLDDAKVGFVGSARLLDRVDGMHMTEDAWKFLARIGHPVMRETIRDYMVNQRFRCDVFVKGPSPMSGPAHRDAWHALPFVLTVPHADIPRKISIGGREIDLPARIYDPVIGVLADDGGRPKCVDELIRDPALRTLTATQVVEALTVLAGRNFASPAQAVTAGIRARCQAFNRHVLKQALTSTHLKYLASPVTGGGVFVPHPSQLFILGQERAVNTPGGLAEHVWGFLDSFGERLLQDGKRVEAREDNIRELKSMAETFLTRTRPLLETLMVLSPITP